VIEDDTPVVIETVVATDVSGVAPTGMAIPDTVPWAGRAEIPAPAATERTIPAAAWAATGGTTATSRGRAAITPVTRRRRRWCAMCVLLVAADGR